MSGVSAADIVKAKDGSGVIGYKDTPVLPWCGFHVHDPDRPAPERIDPGPPSAPIPAPTDAVVLFDGKDVSKWTGDCQVVDACIVAGKGVLATREEFGDVQVHLEWMTPENFEGPWYNQGNNVLVHLNEVVHGSTKHRALPDTSSKKSTGPLALSGHDCPVRFRNIWVRKL